jgi:hypothetical protein
VFEAPEPYRCGVRVIGISLWLASTLAGCVINAELNDHMVVNRSNETVTIVRVSASGEYKEGEWSRGSAPMFWLNGCEDMLLIARTKAGREVSKRSGPFCDDDTWIIAEPGST